jgi:hypothetical protein
MKRLERTFDKIISERPYYSSYICFAKTIKDRNYCQRIIKNYFNKLVEKDDYGPKDKKAILNYLYSLSNSVT